MSVPEGTFYKWSQRYGKANEHNGWIPRDHWLKEWEKHAILDFYWRHPLEGSSPLNIHDARCRRRGRQRLQRVPRAQAGRRSGSAQQQAVAERPGFRTQPWPLLPQHKPQMPNGDVKLFDATIGFESYASHIKASLLWLGATNDFHRIMDDTYRTGELIPHKNVRYSFTPHMNHRFTPEFAVTGPLWFDQYLKGSFTFPKTPETHLIFETKDHVPMLEVKPDVLLDVAEVRIYYSVDPDPRARFWRSAEATKSGVTWTGKLPVLSVDQPLFAFANVVYKLKQSESEPHARPTERFALSSMLHTVAPKDVAANGVSRSGMGVR